MKCPRCQSENDHTALYCGLCYEVLKKESERGRRINWGSPSIEPISADAPKRSHVVFILFALAGLFIGWQAVEIVRGRSFSISDSGPEIVVPTRNLDFHYVKSKEWDDTFMIFGSGDISGEDLVYKISLSLLPRADMEAVYKDYPDFYRCDSRGSKKAMAGIRIYNIVPQDVAILESIQGAVAKDLADVRRGKPHLCIKLKGETLHLKTVTTKGNENVTAQIHESVKQDVALVHFVDTLEMKEALRN